MKTMTLKIDDKLVRTAMKRGGFKRPEDAVTRGLESIIETTQGKMDNELHLDALEEKYLRSKETRNANDLPISPLLKKITGLLKTDKDDKELLQDALDDRFLR